MCIASIIPGAVMGVWASHRSCLLACLLTICVSRVFFFIVAVFVRLSVMVEKFPGCVIRME